MQNAEQGEIEEKWKQAHFIESAGDIIGSEGIGRISIHQQGGGDGGRGRHRRRLRFLLVLELRGGSQRRRRRRRRSTGVVEFLGPSERNVRVQVLGKPLQDGRLAPTDGHHLHYPHRLRHPLPLPPQRERAREFPRPPNPTILSLLTLSLGTASSAFRPNAKLRRYSH